ncbi:MAG: Uncharacterised protein [Cryomorphaceae bacterium]|nr:MAG: Uncharacterised protein [Cryomorphaceae bacterium]
MLITVMMLMQQKCTQMPHMKVMIRTLLMMLIMIMQLTMIMQLMLNMVMPKLMRIMMHMQNMQHTRLQTVLGRHCM